MKTRYWALFLPNDGELVPEQRDRQNPGPQPESVWHSIDEIYWRQLREDGCYTRRSAQRPIAYVTRELQDATPEALDDCFDSDGELIE